MLLCLGVLGVRGGVEALHIHSTSRGVVTVLLADGPVLTFNNDRSLTVEAPSKPGIEPVVLDFDDIEKCEYGAQGDYSSVREMAGETMSAITVALDSDGVTFAGIPEGTFVEVYSIQGLPVKSEKSVSGSYRLERSSLGHGVYIVRIGVFVTKLSF